jgi:hypothetical protein
LRQSESEPVARAILDEVESLLADERTSATRHRYGQAAARFEAYFDALGERILTDAGVAMLEVERSLEPTAALYRVATGEDLLYALPGFISLERPVRLPTSDVRATPLRGGATALHRQARSHRRRRAHVRNLGDRWRAPPGPRCTPFQGRGEEARMNTLAFADRGCPDGPVSCR